MTRTVAASLAAILLACSSSGSSLPETRVSGVASLGADVTVLYDGLGVPHIRASSDGDAAFALGWVQAQDRFFQMDLFRKVARGRLGELLGQAADARQDVFLRTMFTSRQTASTGTHHVEEVIADGLDAGVKAFLQRYADGVNRWLDDVRAGKDGATLHPQYQPLGFTAAEIAPWTIEDSIAIGRLQSFQLSDTSTQELVAGELALSGLDPALLADVTRHAQAVPSVILNSPLRATPPRSALVAPAAAPSGLAAPAAARASVSGALAFRRAVRLPFAQGDKAGSNNWTVAPGRSQSGHVLVANDPHLSLSNPANFHLVHLQTPTRNVAGVAFPGTPAVVIGHNDKIAWGDTVVGYDVTDLYQEALTLDAAQNPVSVTLNGAPVPLQIISETRKVRGSSDQPYTVLLVPHRGPILPGSVQGTSALSVRWTGQDPTYELQAFHELNAAGTVDEAFQALAKFGVGAQNFNIGDTAGHIGYDPHALVPIRGSKADGCLPWLPMPGATDLCDWKGFIPDAELPQAKDPSKGYIATANNDVTGALLGNDPLAATNPHYLYAYTDIGFREQRIQSQLEASAQQTLDGMTALQADNHSLLAETMMPGLLALLQGQTLSAGAQTVVQLWQGWDFSTPRGDEAGAGVAQASAASAAFHAFLRRFADRTLTPRLSGVSVPGFSLPQALPDEQSMKIVVGLTQGLTAGSTYPLQAPATTWCGGSCSAAATSALEDTVTFLGTKLPAAAAGTWRWGDLHHVLFESPVRPLLPDFGPFPNDGGLFTVDVANFDLFADTFEQHSGPNVRIATELDPKGVRSRMVIPGGQTDRPALVAGAQADPHYMDQVPAWLANAPGDQPFSDDEVNKAAKRRLVFSK